LGATTVVTPDELFTRRAELLPDGADVVVDAVGSVLAQAIDIAAQSARLVIFGMNSNARPPIHQTEITEKGLTIMGSYITNFTFPPAIKLVESGLVDFRPMISGILPLDQTADGIARLRSGEATKIVIRP
jgi:threonine dehydrogenase-like Zn-dependent dehydrogenase